MSNFLAIATVTATLQQLLQTSIAADVPDATVKMGPPKPPTAGQTTPEVTIFLYQVAPNIAYRNADAPTRDSRGRLIKQPCAAIDLFYLVSFIGDEQQLEPQRLLGSAIRTLHTQPLLDKNLIAATIQQPLYQFLAKSDLATNLIESIKFTQHPSPFEEVTKLWTSFFPQVPYTLSVVYQASVVLIDAAEIITASPLVSERVIQLEQGNGSKA